MFKKLGEFVSEKKANKNFKKAGPGHTLGSEPSAPRSLPARIADLSLAPPTPQSETNNPIRSAAAQAALARAQGRPPTDVKRKDLGGLSAAEMQQAVATARTSASQSVQPQPALQPALQPAAPSEPVAALDVGIRYLCPACGASFLAAVVQDHIAMCMAAAVAGEAETAAAADASLPVLATLMATCASSADAWSKAAETLQRYMGNVVSDPSNPKFRRIKLSNKVFASTIADLPGAMLFLRALGFLPMTDDTGESFLALADERMPEFLDVVPEAIDALETAAPATGTLDRDTRVYLLDASSGSAASLTSRFVVPDEFFVMTTADVSQLASARRAEVERESTLRTHAMREEQRLQGRRRTKYAVVRFRVGAQLLVQATFSSHETIADLRFFCQSILADELSASEFSLVQPGLAALDDDEMTLWDAGLTPLALLVLRISTLGSAMSSECPELLKPELMAKAAPLY